MSGERSGKTATARLGARVVMLLLLAAIVPYVRLPAKPFVSDSIVAIVKNPIVRDGSLAEIVTHDFWGVESHARWATRSYRPVISLSFALEMRLFGPNPVVFHLTDMALHAAATLLLALLLLELGTGRQAAALGALLFAVHPLASEAVCSTVGRADLVASLAMLAGVLAHLRAGRAARPYAWEAAALAAGAVALLSKEYAVVYPFLLMAADVATGGDRRWRPWSSRRVVVTWSAALALLGAYLGLRLVLFGALGGVPMIGAGDHPLWGKPLSVRWATAAWLLVHGARLVVAPFGLTYFYSAGTLPVIANPLDVRVLAGVLLVAGLCTLAAWSVLRRRDPRPALGAALFLFPLAPSLNTVSLAGVLFAERFFYLPLAGVVLMLAPALGFLFRRLPRLVPAAALVALALAALTVLRVEEWSSIERLARSSIRWYPDGSGAWSELGLAQGAKGNHEAAAAAFEKALETSPDKPFIWRQYAVSLMRLGRFDEAIAAWRRTLDLSPPDLAPLWRGLGTAQLAAGRIEEAVRSLQTARRLMPDDPLTRTQLARALLRLAEDRMARGRGREAADFAERALELGTLDPERRFRAALVLDRAGRRPRARALFREVLEQDPQILRRLHSLAVSLDEKGQHLDAARLFAQILAARPDHVPTLFNLGRSLLLAGHAREAIAPLERGLAIHDDPAARKMLAEARARASRPARKSSAVRSGTVLRTLR